MKIILLVFAVIFLSATTSAQSTSHDSTTETSTLKTSVVTVVPSASPTDSTSTSSSTSSTTTSKPTTTSTPETTKISSTTTSTPKTTTVSTTSTTSPETTTSSSTTPKATTPSPAPTTETTTSHETTSVEPTPSPTPSTPDSGYWNVTEGNTTCIRAKLAIRFKIEVKDKIDYILLSPTASSDLSQCNTTDGTETLVLKDVDYNIIFTFEKKDDNAYVKNITFTYYLPFSTETFSNDSHLFEMKVGNSYLCNTLNDVILGNVTMEIFSLHVQSFGAENNKDFGAVEECGADNPINDIVPIAVGVALLALVVVVLIAYLVGRRRSRQKGYQSV